MPRHLMLDFIFFHIQVVSINWLCKFQLYRLACTIFYFTSFHIYLSNDLFWIFTTKFSYIIIDNQILSHRLKFYYISRTSHKFINLDLVVFHFRSTTRLSNYPILEQLLTRFWRFHNVYVKSDKNNYILILKLKF